MNSGDTNSEGIQVVKQQYIWQNRDEDSGLVITLSVTKPKVNFGEDFEVSVFLRNHSQKEVEVYLPGLLGQVIIIVRSESPEIPDPQSIPMYFSRAKKNDDKDFIMLEPSETFGRVFRLGNLPVGEFEISAMYRARDNTKKYSLIARSDILWVVK